MITSNPNPEGHVVEKPEAIRASLWVVEMREPDAWTPTVGAGLSPADAEKEMRDYWMTNNPHDRFRVRRYVRDTGALA